jgi:hypothetical protein
MGVHVKSHPMLKSIIQKRRMPSTSLFLRERNTIFFVKKLYLLLRLFLAPCECTGGGVTNFVFSLLIELHLKVLDFHHSWKEIPELQNVWI